MIIFKVIRWKNFLSTGNVFTEISLNQQTNTLIVGENGAGKSTILDALTFSLFGKSYRKINKPQLVNSITNKNTVVEIEFDVGENQYKIIRGLKPNLFEVYCNDQLINQSAEMRDYQEHLEKNVLKMNYKTFCQVVILGTASFVPFMQLPAGGRREIVEDLLDLQIFTTMNLLLKDKIQQNNEKISEISYDQKVIQEKLKLIQQHLQEKQNTNEKLVAEKIQLIEDTQDKIETLKADIKTMSDKSKELAEQTKSVSDVEDMINKIEKMKHKLQAKTALYNKDINFFNNHDNCPTCTQVIEEQIKIERISEKQQELADMGEKLSLLEKKYIENKQLLKEINLINNQIRDLVLEISRNENNIKYLETYCKQLEKEIKNINDLHELDEDTKMQDLENELNLVAEKYNEAMDQKLTYTAASYLLKDGGIKARIIKQYVPIINKLIAKYLSSLDFFVQFELDEEFNETIKSRYRDEFSYASFSEGEKMRINLAILFTWRAVARLRNSVACNLLIMDEVMDSSMDVNGTEEFLKLLFQLTNDTNTFIISHKSDQLYDKFASVIKFEKKQNFSRIA